MVWLGAPKNGPGGDIVSDVEYENFDLSWQRKVTNGGNSVVMYHVVESAKYKAPYESGPAYQIIDDIGFSEKLYDWQKSGADFAMNILNSRKKLYRWDSGIPVDYSLIKDRLNSG